MSDTMIVGCAIAWESMAAFYNTKQAGRLVNDFDRSYVRSWPLYVDGCVSIYPVCHSARKPPGSTIRSGVRFGGGHRHILQEMSHALQNHQSCSRLCVTGLARPCASALWFATRRHHEERQAARLHAGRLQAV